MVHLAWLCVTDLSCGSSGVWRRRGSAVECRTLERESPGSNPLHYAGAVVATTKQNPCNCTWQ